MKINSSFNLNNFQNKCFKKNFSFFSSYWRHQTSLWFRQVLREYFWGGSPLRSSSNPPEKYGMWISHHIRWEISSTTLQWTLQSTSVSSFSPVPNSIKPNTVHRNHQRQVCTELFTRNVQFWGKIYYYPLINISFLYIGIRKYMKI